MQTNARGEMWQERFILNERIDDYLGKQGCLGLTLEMKLMEAEYDGKDPQIILSSATMKKQIEGIISEGESLIVNLGLVRLPSPDEAPDFDVRVVMNSMFGDSDVGLEMSVQELIRTLKRHHKEIEGGKATLFYR